MTSALAAEALLAERAEANARWFGFESERLARTCHAMADRFARGGRLLALGATPQARSDARHVAVEFVHPVIVGKRALPAIALSLEGGDVSAQVDLLATETDIAIAFGAGTGEALELAERRGCLAIALQPPTADPFVAQELTETAYHLLWELVHVFFEHRGMGHDAGRADFLYPFLGEPGDDPEAVIADVARSVEAKAEEIAALQAQTLTDGIDELRAAAAAMRRGFDAGGRLLALGNGGSATDAMDVVADFRSPPYDWPRRPAIDLTEDTAIITALANDIGTDAIFARQVIAYGRAGDALLALSTSGNSTNVIEALGEARRRGLVTVAMVGYDGGRVADERLADHVVVTRSEHIPRIQEAQASAYHVLRELVESPGR